MAVSSRFILEQGPVIRGLVDGAVDIAMQSTGMAKPAASMQTPGPLFQAKLPPRSPELIRAYVRNVGGQPGAYRKIVPAHLFPQWCFPLSTKTLKGIPYPLAKVMNGGCRLEINEQIPSNQPIVATGQLTEIDDNGSRAVLKQKLTTGTEANPEAVVGYFFPIIPLGRGGGGGKKKDKARVPTDVREIARLKVGPKAGLDFAKLTGDFNPIHWVPAYARSFGFRGVILHGFGTMGRAIEAINRNVLAGDVTAMKTFDCRFTRPLHIPARVGVYVDAQNGVYVGDAPGGPAYLVGSYETR